MFYNGIEFGMVGSAHSFVARPADAGHGHAVLVFDGAGRLHLPLTSFGKEAARRLSAKSVTVYLYALLPFFTFLDSGGAGDREVWAGDSRVVRHSVSEYLEERLGCILRRHRLGFELVSVTGRTRANVGAFLAALKLFYVVMCEMGCYSGENPLVDMRSDALNDHQDDGRGAESDDPPRMPEISGVVEPASSRRRLTDSFFKLVGREWIPQIVDDSEFPVLVLSGGRKVPGWGLREECVTRLLFETGGRIFEVTGLTLGDWANRGLTREATAASKGSHGRRVKFFRFSSNTATLLRRCFDSERRKYDSKNWRLADYLRAHDDKLIDLSEVPLFLSRRGTQFSAKSFRETYWTPACKAAGLDADPHQARHWYVTMTVRTIHETSSTEAEIHRRIRELIEYMQWRGGEQTMAAYDHYFDGARHADIQDQLHERLRVALEQGLKRHSMRSATTPPPVTQRPAFDPDLAFLRALGGGSA
jgi:integrase